MPRSYWLPDGKIIFVYMCNIEMYARKWRVGVRGERGELRAIQWFKPIPWKRYSEAESLADLRAYAREHNLEPAY